jgi:hypothetical protein
LDDETNSREVALVIPIQRSDKVREWAGLQLKKPRWDVHNPHRLAARASGVQASEPFSAMHGDLPVSEDGQNQPVAPVAVRS